MRLPLALTLLLAAAPCAARDVDQADDAWLLREGRQLRFDYANDFFAGEDRYHTQGLGLTYFDPALRASPLMRLLPALPGGERHFGLALRHSGFTPASLSHDEALRDDRPFAAYLYLGHRLVSRDRGRGLTLTAGLDAGIIGQGAGGKWMQTGIHRALGNLLPRGWDNQVRNDVVLDYSARLEKTVVTNGRADLALTADATLGTLYTNASAGAIARLGSVAEEAGKRAFIFVGAEQKLVGYDATLQGGLFNDGSPHVIASRRVTRAVSRVDAGVVLDLGGFALEFRRVLLGPEFKGGLSHGWGRLSLIKRF